MARLSITGSVDGFGKIAPGFVGIREPHGLTEDGPAHGFAGNTSSPYVLVVAS